MARSDYIYVVRDPDGRIEAGFTVKHECKSYLGRLSETDRLYFTVTRIRDNPYGGPPAVTMRVPEFLAPK